MNASIINPVPPDFKNHKNKSNNEYYLPRIKDGLTTTVKNVAFIHQFSQSKKNIIPDEEDTPSKSLDESLENLQNSRPDLRIVSESPIKRKILKQPKTTINKDLF